MFPGTRSKVSPGRIACTLVIGIVSIGPVPLPAEAQVPYLAGDLRAVVKVLRITDGDMSVSET